MTFPNWTRTIPKGDHKIINFTMESGYWGKSHNYISIAKFIRELSTEHAINFTYLEDLMKNVDWKAQIFEKEKAIKFVYKELTAVIMLMDAT